MQTIPTITKQLLIINCIAFLASLLVPSISSWCGLHYWQASQFHVYQFVNMFALWMFGPVMERTWGPQRFLTYYLVCGIGAGLMQEMAQFCSFFIDLSSQGVTIGQILKIDSIMPGASEMLNGWTTVGASGSIYGILLAFGMTYPEERMFIIPIPFPIKAKCSRVFRVFGSTCFPML